MLRLRVKELLVNSGKSKYWLHKQFKMTYQNFNNMLENRTKSIRYDVLDKLCEVFCCDIDNLFDKN